MSSFPTECRFQTYGQGLCLFTCTLTTPILDWHGTQSVSNDWVYYGHIDVTTATVVQAKNVVQLNLYKNLMVGIMHPYKLLLKHKHY